MDATADLDAAAQLDAWLKKHVAEPRRALARGAASNLADYATCEEADLEDVLQISTWPPLARSRFLRAWRKLKGDEALTGTATVATQTDVVGAVPPVVAAAAAAAADDDFELSGDDDDSDGGARNGPKRRRGPRTATSRFRGVHKAKNKWQVRYTGRDGAPHHVGTYDDEEVAALKYNEAIRAAKLTDIRAINPVVDGRPQPKPVARDKSAARPPDPQRVKTTGSTSQYYGPCWDSRRRRWQAKVRDASEKTVWSGTYNDEETAAREYHAAVHRFGLQAIRRTSVDASGALVPKPTSPKASPHLKPAASSPSSPPSPPKAKSPAPPPPPKSAAERSAPQPKKPSPAPPRPRTPPLEAFRKHAGPDGDRKAAVAAFFAAQSSDEAPPPKKARTDDAIGDGEVLSEMF